MEETKAIFGPLRERLALSVAQLEAQLVSELVRESHK